MVPKQMRATGDYLGGFRAVLFRMVPKLSMLKWKLQACFRAVLFRMVPKPLNQEIQDRIEF